MSKKIVPANPTSADLREYHPLARLRTIIRAYVAIEGILSALILVALWFWISFALDFGIHYFFNIDLLDKAKALRTALIIVTVTGILAVLAFYILRRIFRDFRSSALALVLEKRYPDLLGDRLITAVELANLKRAEEQGYSVDMIKLTMKDAQERVNQISVGSVFNWNRLLVMGWLLVGVTLVAMLASYPLAALFSLIGQNWSQNLSRMLVVNGLLLATCAFVFLLPLAFLYFTRASKNIRIIFATVGIALVAACVGFSIAYKDANAMSAGAFRWRFQNAAEISLERNLLFENTRWPADHYFVEFLDFPVQEKRVEYRKDLLVRAYFCRFIVADLNADRGWRPVQWSDLGRVLPGQQLPELPLDRIRAAIASLTEGEEGSAVGYKKDKLELPGRDEIKVDLALAVIGDTSTTNSHFTVEEKEAFGALAVKLERRAADPKLGGRVIRNVASPEKLALVYNTYEIKNKEIELNGGGGEVDLINMDERKSVYGGKLSKIEESNFLHAEGRFNERIAKSIERKVVAVHPPKAMRLTYQEFSPAYYFHLPPYGPRGDETLDQRRVLLRDLRQTLRELKFEPAPERAPITIALGSDLKVTFLADKELKEATLVPLSKSFPGIAEKEEPASIPLKLNSDGKSFTIDFKSTGKPISDYLAHQWMANLPVLPNDYYLNEWLAHLIVAPDGVMARDLNPVFLNVAKSMDFEVTMKDTDNMSSSRAVFVKPTDDKGPEVNLYVDIIRKHQNRYLCTTRAEIPFAKESYATDDNGLHKIEYTYEYIPLANATVTSQRAEMAAWLWASSPLQPTIGDYLFRREILLRTVSGQKGPAAIKGTFSVPAFDALMTKSAPEIKTLANLRELLSKPLPDGFASPLMNRFEFRGEDRPEVFDLDKLLPELARKDPKTGAEGSFELVLNVRVTDSNVAGGDRFAENKEAPLLFRIVPREELAAVISREEGELARRFDEIIKKMEAAQQTLRQSASRILTITPETAVSEQTRLEGILENVVKSRELTGEIANDYNRIIREYEVNRFESIFTAGLRSKIKTPLEEVQIEEFAQEEEELAKLHAVLKDGRADTAGPLTGPTVLKMQQLIDRLKQIRNSMGETFDLNRTLNKLKGIIDGELVVQREINDLNKELIDNLLNIRIVAPASVSIAAGKSEKVTVQLRMPQTLLSDPFLRFEIPANSGLKINPVEIKLADTAMDASFEIAAGAAPGNYSLRIVPTQGKPVDIKVVVK